jgi:predicted metalloprotease
MRFRSYAVFKRVLRVALVSAALGATLIPLSASAATLPPANPANSTPAARTTWNNQWLAWAQTTIAENTGYWRPIMGSKFYQPYLRFLQSTPITTPCGTYTLDDQAAYCPGDNTIFVNAQFLEKQDATYGAHAAQLILAHEFGHHIQHLQGLPNAGMMTELQADCLAGASMFSMSSAEKLDTSVWRTMGAESGHAGDPSVYDRDHGTGDERVAALIDGLNDLSNCNLTNPTGFYYPTNL